MFRLMTNTMLLLSISFFLPLYGHAEPSGPTLLLYFENDLFFNTDYYYTNAVQVRFITPNLKTIRENSLLPEGVSDALSNVPFPGNASAIQYNLSLGVGQQIYTPADTQATAPQPNDRPYAGYLYGTLALHAKQYNRLDTLELAAGVVGPSSLAEQAQNGVHRLRGFDTAKGWDNQLRDEPVVMLTWTRTWRLNTMTQGRFGADLLPRVGVSLGTPFTNAVAGLELRFGWNLPPDYGTSSIRPGSGINAPAGDEAAVFHPVTGFWNNLSLYVFLGCEGKAVAYNTFLDGNIWRDSPSVDKRPLVGELSGGVALEVYGARLTFTHVYRTDEFYGQSKGQQIGSISLGYTF